MLQRTKGPGPYLTGQPGYKMLLKTLGLKLLTPYRESRILLLNPSRKGNVRIGTHKTKPRRNKANP